MKENAMRWWWLVGLLAAIACGTPKMAKLVIPLAPCIAASHPRCSFATTNEDGTRCCRELAPD